MRHGDDDGEVEQLQHRVVLQQLGQREDEECRKQINLKVNSLKSIFLCRSQIVYFTELIYFYQLKRSEKKQQIMESFADPGSEKHDVEGYIS